MGRRRSAALFGHPGPYGPGCDEGAALTQLAAASTRDICGQKDIGGLMRVSVAAPDPAATKDS